MLVTEEEAEGKECVLGCIVGALIIQSALNNGIQNVKAYSPCTGSKCRGWRWGKLPYPKMKIYHDFGVARDDFTSSGWVYEYTSVDKEGRKFDVLFQPDNDNDPKTHGFCGLAGKPE